MRDTCARFSRFCLHLSFQQHRAAEFARGAAPGGYHCKAAWAWATGWVRRAWCGAHYQQGLVSTARSHRKPPGEDGNLRKQTD
jgi:hypothetical protein